MNRRCACVAAVTLAAATQGCGDDSRACGMGTADINGLCVPATTITCGDGTKLENAQCVVDPESCEAGTVLIANRCVDPVNDLVVDLEESAEPNGLGVATGVEASVSPAGAITLKQPGEPFIVHGHLTPFRDADEDGQRDPDVDTYLITVTAATLLEISVDGTGGAQGAFYVAGPLPSYERYGLNLTGDTSLRRLLLPLAGVYKLAITDTRSLGIGKNQPGPAGTGGAAGGPFAEYFASITVEAIPTPAPIAIASGAGRQDGTLATDEVRFYTIPLGAGFSHIVDAMPGAAAASLAVTDRGVLLAYQDEAPGPPATEAETTVVGISPGDDAIIVLDTVYNYGPEPEPFVLTITQQ